MSIYLGSQTMKPFWGSHRVGGISPWNCAVSATTKLRELASEVGRWVSVLDIDEETTHHYAAVGVELKRTGKPIPANDLWIETLCREHALSLLSRDRHFDLVSGIQRIDW
jgi:predicted nucleic acid-binding protein